MCEESLLTKPNLVLRLYLSPYGELLLGVVDERLFLCYWYDARYRQQVERKVYQRWGFPVLEEECASFSFVESSLTDYFQGQLQHFDLPIHWSGTDFQQRVWRALFKVPYGRTITYRELAQEIGQPTAVRAVAHALAMNPLQIVVPCHRVVGCNERPIGYAGGENVKTRLLQMEKMRCLYPDKLKSIELLRDDG